MSVGLLSRIQRLESTQLSLMTERDSDTQRKRVMRSQACRIWIPDCKNQKRRERCLADPELFLKTYFADRYSRPFGKHHYEMIDAILNRAKHGGRQAVAAPRGCGKSELVKGMNVYLVLAGLVRFLLPVAATTAHAGKLYADFQKKIASNDLLHQDFPEVCHPVRELEGAPQRAARQHVDGRLTHIKWTASEYLSLPEVPGSPYGGVKMAYYGLDAAFRGINIDGDRPDFVLVDDPETRESARSALQIEDREKILDQDVAGLAEEGKDLAIVVLTTIQNRYCLSYRLTNRDPEKGKPAWNGMRFGVIEEWPDEKAMELWQEYVAKRHSSQAAGDEHGMEAVQFYLDNRPKMDAGHRMLTDYFEPAYLSDGRQVTHSALQAAWNRIADTSMEAFNTEFQNDPAAEEDAERSALTPGRVIGQTSGLQQGRLPSEFRCITMGIDIGKHSCHWVKTAWDEKCVGWITDYGVLKTYGLHKHSSDQAIELALVQALESFADSEVTEDGPLLVLIDSGAFTSSIYEACHRLGPPYYPAKGWAGGTLRMPKVDEHNQPFLEAYARRQLDDQRRKPWLYNVNSEWWKEWAQDRFLVDPFFDQNRVRGSLALFEPPSHDIKFHATFARHMVSEGVEYIPVPNKESKRQWVVRDRHNNHWLDALALACAAAGCVGIRLVQPEPKVMLPPKPTQPRQKPLTTYGRPFLATER